MRQQINFYNSKLVQPKDWFSLTTVVIIYALCAGLILLWQQILETDANAREQESKVAKSQFEEAEKRLAEAMAKSASQNASDLSAQEADLKALKEKYASQEKIIAAFEQTRSGKRMHVADYMSGLSHQKVENLWLTGFKLDIFKNYVGLTGRAYKTELVPKYIEALSRESVFGGQLFGGLQMKEVELSKELPKEQSATQGASQNATANVTPQGTNSANTQSAAANTPTTQNNSVTPVSATNASAKSAAKTIKLIEFEIKGLEVVPNVDHEVDANKDDAVTMTPLPADKKVGEPIHG